MNYASAANAIYRPHLIFPREAAGYVPQNRRIVDAAACSDACAIATLRNGGAEDPQFFLPKAQVCGWDYCTGKCGQTMAACLITRLIGPQQRFCPVCLHAWELAELADVGTPWLCPENCVLCRQYVITGRYCDEKGHSGWLKGVTR